MKSEIDYSLYLITHETVSSLEQLERLIQDVIEGGVNVIQLREKEATTRSFLEKAKKIKSLLENTNIKFLVNDRIDIALASNADGVHIGQNDMPHEDTRKLIGPNAIIGYTVNTLAQALEAEKLDIDYLGVAQIFPSFTKPLRNPTWQLEGLTKLRSLSKKKLIAVGGINQFNAPDVIKAGADGVAVVAAICHQQNPKLAALDLSSAIQKAKKLKQSMPHGIRL